MKVLLFSSLILANLAVLIRSLLFGLPKIVYIGRGKCPTVEVISEFTQAQYLGLWYEIARFPVLYELNSECVTAEYSELSPGVIEVKNSDNRPDDGDNQAVGRATTPDAGEPGKLRVSFAPEFLETIAYGVLSFAGIQAESNYWILDTDYETYSLVHSCQQRRGFHTMANWILSRTPDPGQTFIDEKLAVFSGYGIPVDEFIFTEQGEDCGHEVDE